MATTVTRRLEEVWEQPSGLGSWLNTVDHKKIGRRYLYTAFGFFVAGGILALLMRTQLIAPNQAILGPEAFNQAFSMHGITMIFFFVTPMLFGFGNFFVPLMIGARDMAFPRLNAFSYWVFLFAGLFMYSSFLIGQAPNDGWFNYVPLANLEFTPTVNIDYYALGLIFLGISTTAGAINFIVTILKLRAPGMTIGRMPLFVWAILATSLAVIFALPSLTAANVMLALDRMAGFHFFDVQAGGSVLLWQHLFWIFGHPDVYIIFLPAVGIVSTIVPVFARRRIVGYVWLALATMVTAVIGFGVWVHHMFAVGLPAISMTFFAAASLLITIPSGVQIFAWLATVLSGRPRLDTPMLFILAFIFVFVVGGVTGVMFAVVPFDQAITDSYFVVAHFHYVLVGGAVFPIFGAIYYWIPKIFGRMMDERLGKAAFWTIFLGFNLTFFPMHISGLLGMPRRIYTYQAGLGWEPWNLIATLGGYLMAAGIALVAVGFVHALRAGVPAGRNPWDADSLEWATSSPPPAFNFAQIPMVHSREPVWDQTELHALDEEVRRPEWTLTEGHETVGTTVLDGKPESVLEMPSPSLAPIATALGLAVVFAGLISRLWLIAALGGLLVAIAMLRWAHSAEEGHE